MKRISHAIVLFLAAAFLSLWGPFSEARGQSITITDPVPGATVNIGPGSQPMKIKATFPPGFQPEEAELKYTNSQGAVVTLPGPLFVVDQTTLGGYVFFIYMGSGTATNCTVTVKGFRPATSGGDPRVDISTSSGGITVHKEK